MEDTIAVGIVALVLALIASASFKSDRRIAFWYVIGVVALLLAVGDATPLARFTRALPVYGLFRIPGRHAFEWTFAVSVLAGYGTAALMRRAVSAKRLAVAIVLALVVIAVAYEQFTLGATSNASYVAGTHSADIARVVSPLTNGALGFPIVAATLGLVLVCAGARLGRSAAGVLVALAVVVDLGGFAFPAYWNWAAIDPSTLAPPTFAGTIVKKLHTSRALSIRTDGIILRNRGHRALGTCNGRPHADDRSRAPAFGDEVDIRRTGMDGAQ